MPIRKEGFHEGRASVATNDLHEATATGASATGSPEQQYNQQTANAASQARDYLNDKSPRVGDKIRNLRAIDYSRVVERVKKRTRRKPGQSILISASAGFVIGLLLRGQRRK